MAELDLKVRTKHFALRVIRMFAELPRTHVAEVIGKQVLRSGTSVGANYREGCRARSTSEFVAKLGICLQELEETCYWLELLIEADVFPEVRLAPLHQEATELIAILTASVRTAKKHKTTRRVTAL